MVIGGKHFGQYTYEHWFDHEYEGTIPESAIVLRPEEEDDYRIVEYITREAFWNVYCPGCDEHLLMHTMRDDPAFITELDTVAVCNDAIVGNIAYAKAKILDGTHEYDVITFGPVSVLPHYQKKGIGKKLITYTIQKATEMGFNAILIYGNPPYYSRFGFRGGKEFGITNMEGNFQDALQALELVPKALENIHGKFCEGAIYQVDKSKLEEFDKIFPPKEKLVLDTQIFKE